METITSKKLTIRTGETLRAALEERARLQGTILSEVERPLGSKSGHLRGTLSLPGTAGDPWRDALRRRNWRP